MYHRPERRSSRGVRIVASVALALATAACGFPVGPFRARASDTWTRSYPISTTGEVSVANVNGRVDVAGVDGSTVAITADRIARGATDPLANDLLRRVSTATLPPPASGADRRID